MFKGPCGRGRGRMVVVLTTIRIQSVNSIQYYMIKFRRLYILFMFCHYFVVGVIVSHGISDLNIINFRKWQTSEINTFGGKW
jgi:hypothetical protein